MRGPAEEEKEGLELVGGHVYDESDMAGLAIDALLDGLGLLR